MMVKLRADVGAIKFVLSGANIMAPGLTSAGATIHAEVGSRLPCVCALIAVAMSAASARQRPLYKYIEADTCSEAMPFRL